MSSRTKALLAIIAASLLWSTAGVAKVLVRAFDPFVIAFFRFFIASLFILPFFLKEKVVLKKAVKDLVPMALFSTGNIALFYLGLTTTTANAATIIYTAEPLVVAFLAKRLIAEEITAKKILGIIIGLFGVLFIVALPIFEQDKQLSGDTRGNLLIVAAVLSWALYTITSRRALSSRLYSPLTVSAVSIFTSCAVFFIIALFTYQGGYLIRLWQPGNFLLILHLGVLVTVATYFLFQLAIKHSSATTASLNAYLQPVLSVTFNILFLGERLTIGFLAGSILVILGVLVATGAKLIQEVKNWLPAKR